MKVDGLELHDLTQEQYRIHEATFKQEIKPHERYYLLAKREVPPPSIHLANANAKILAAREVAAQERMDKAQAKAMRKATKRANP